MGKRSSFINKFHSPTSNSTSPSSTFQNTSKTPIITTVATFGSPPPPPPHTRHSVYSKSDFFRAPHQPSPLETKRYNNTKCAICEDWLSMTLLGEVIVPLKCNHMCHKNCLILMNSDSITTVTCLHCTTDTLNLNATKNLMASPKPFDFDIPDNIPTEPNLEESLPNAPPIANKAPYTPVEQISSSFTINNQLETPSLFNDKEELDIYKPRLLCIDETSSVKLGPLNEISFVLNIKSPQIFNNSQNLNFLELQLKHQVQEFVTSRLDIEKDASELMIFDKLKISVNGDTWDEIIAYLFEDQLLLYNVDVLIGVLSVSTDISSINLFNPKCLVLNLAKESLPELHIQCHSEIIITKWETFISKLMKGENVESNIYQFTTTCWNDLVDHFDLPQNLISLNVKISDGSSVQNSYLCKILTPPDALTLNLVVSVPLVNTSNLSDSDYRQEIQYTLRQILKSLRAFDKLGLIFIGVDGSRRPNPSGSFIGCVESQWSGWEQIINDILIVPNSFSSHLQEIRTAITKCMDLYPFIPISEKSINKFLILNSNSYDIENNESWSQLTSLIKPLNDKLSITLIRIGDDYNGTELFKKVSRKFDTPLLRFEDFPSFSSSIPSLIQQVLQNICIPKFSINLRPNRGVKISQIDDIREDLEQEEIILDVLDILPQTEKNIMIKVQVDESFNNLDHLRVPILEYDGVWFNDHQLNKQIAYSCIKSTMAIQPPLTPTEVNHNDNSLSFLSKEGTFIDIPLLPPLSPTRDPSFAKRQTELTIIDSLQRALSVDTITEAQNILNGCISLAFGTMRESINFQFRDDNESNLASGVGGFHMLDWTLAAKDLNQTNEEYIIQLVNRMKFLIQLYADNQMSGKAYCLDMLNSLI